MYDDLMSDQVDKIIKSLKLFGLNESEALIYSRLLKEDRKSALQLSRLIQIPRTKVYRTLEKLIEKGLVIEQIDGYGTKFKAESYERLNNLLKQKREEYEEISKEAPMLFNQLAKLQSEIDEDSKVLHYRGVEGLKQVTYNSTKAKDIFRIYEIDLLHTVIDQKFAEEMRIEFAKLPVQFRQLTNRIKIDPYTNVTAHIDQWEVRHIPKEKLEIKFEIQIYNNVYCLYDYTKDDVFIVEIYNAKLAEMQKQLYDFIWDNALKMKKLDRHGAAEVTHS